ncbi:hypothetical protein [Kordiimonas gwangyangensis]|uniref:hypothetical protein n=1 Tax=Kordiimonas gwangyangensis TaxID=288022 RepID=UPI0003AAA07C|nr:hypothetical protein [Kordiimonas gwangyangensis]
MMDTSRRTFLGASVALSLLPFGAKAAQPGPTPAANSVGTIESDLKRYVGFGNKRAGGVGDTACGNWLAAELEAAGYTIERQTFSAPFFEVDTAELRCGDTTAPIYPQPIVMTTGPKGVSGPLVRVDAKGRAAGSLTGAIALVDLPHRRWSSLLAKPVRGPIEAAFAGGANAVVAITNGPTGKMIALNTDGRKPMFSGPLALMAPEDADAFLAGAIAGKAARLTIEGEGGRRPAFNFVGRMDRGKGHWLAVSTPRSGWFTCAAERGPGVAAWLDLARWAAAALPDHDLAFICNTGHEYEYLGAAEAMKEIAPPPDKTRFWLHVGANVAARDWHDLPGYLVPLPSVDSQRFLSISPALLPLAREIFAGEAGYERPLSTDVLTAGELDEVVKAGYPRAAGVFGIHRYHHVAEDDERCLNVAATASAAMAFRKLVETVANSSA